MSHLKPNAVRQLEAARTDFRLHSYAVEDGQIDARAVAEKLSVPPERLFKTLVTRTAEGAIAVFCIPGTTELDLKKAARAAGAKSLSLVRVAELKELTGYERGGCSPIGMKHDYPLWVEESIMMFDRVLVSAGRKGLQIELSPEELIDRTAAVTADLV